MNVRTLLLLFGALLAEVSLAQSSLTNGLIAFYPFSGNAIDESRQREHATTIQATLAPDRYGVLNSAYSFDGVASYIDTTDSLAFRSLSNRYTISFWMYAITNTPGASYMVSKDIWAMSQWAIFTSSLDTNVYLHTKLLGPICWTAFDYGVWTHLLFTSDSNRLTCYKNGVPVHSTNINAVLPSVDGAKLRFGGARHWNGSPISQFKGALDQVRIYNRPLSDEEVRKLYEIEAEPQVQLRKIVQPSFAGLRLGTSYQLQLSADLNTWTNHEAAFVATNSNMVFGDSWYVNCWNGLYFRLQKAP